MDYVLLSDDSKVEALAGFLHGQEQDHYLHTINRDRYRVLLERLAECPFRDRIQRLHDETCERLGEVEAIIVATRPSLPGADELRAAMARLTLRRGAK